MQIAHHPRQHDAHPRAAVSTLASGAGRVGIGSRADGAVGRCRALSGTVHHFIFLKAAREGWPVVSPLMRLMLRLMLRLIVPPIVRLIVRDEMAQKDRLMRDNYGCHGAEGGRDAAKLVKLKTMGERVCGLASMKADELKLLQPGGGSARAAGGKRGLYVLAPNPWLEQLQSLVSGLDEATNINTDLFTCVESRLQKAALQRCWCPARHWWTGPSAPASVSAATPSTAAPRRTSAWTFRPRPGRPSRPLQAGLW